MSATLTQFAWAIRHPRAHQVDPSCHPMTRRERRWFREQGSLAGSFGNPDAARLATLRVLGVDPKADAGLGPTGRRP